MLAVEQKAPSWQNMMIWWSPWNLRCWSHLEKQFSAWFSMQLPLSTAIMPDSVQNQKKELHIRWLYRMHHLLIQKLIIGRSKQNFLGNPQNDRVENRNLVWCKSSGMGHALYQLVLGAPLCRSSINPSRGSLSMESMGLESLEFR